MSNYICLSASNKFSEFCELIQFFEKFQGQPGERRMGFLCFSEVYVLTLCRLIIHNMHFALLYFNVWKPKLNFLYFSQNLYFSIMFTEIAAGRKVVSATVMW